MYLEEKLNKDDMYCKSKQFKCNGNTRQKHDESIRQKLLRQCAAAGTRKNIL